MATYFIGRNEVDSFTLRLDQGRSSITCKIFEHWEDTDNTTTARCGDPGVIEEQKVVGITERDEHTLKSSIEGTIGAKGIAEVKSKIEASIKHEVSFHKEESTSKTTTFSSSKCGRKTMFVYQLIREYEFYYSRRKWGFTKSWERKIRERTNVHDFMPDIDDFDENCNCKRPLKPENFDGMVVIDMGNISIRAPYRRVPEGVEVKLESSLLKVSISSSEDFLIKIPVAALPEMVVFLGDITGDSVEAAFYEYKQVLPDVNISFESVHQFEESLTLSDPSVEILQPSGKYEGEI